jgi:hypothetical protein
MVAQMQVHQAVSTKNIHMHVLAYVKQLQPLSSSGKLGELQVYAMMVPASLVSYTRALNLKMQARVFMERVPPTGKSPLLTTPSLILCLKRLTQARQPNHPSFQR